MMAAALPPPAAPVSRSASTTRAAFLDAALAQVEAHGHAELSFRQLCRDLGASVGAPFHHFGDRKGLLSAVALAGYADLMPEDLPNDGTPEAVLTGLGLGLLHFAERRPNLFDLMYDRALFEGETDPQIRAYQMRGHGLIASQLRRARPGLAEDEVEIRTFTFWATLWGHASLMNRQALRTFDSLALPPDMAARIVRLAVQSVLAP